MKPQRELLFLEKLNACRNRNDLYNNFHITAKYNNKITEELLSNALEVLLRKHSVFTLTIAKMDQEASHPVADDLRFTPVDSLQYCDVVEVVDQPFDESQLAPINEKTIVTYYPTVTWKVILYSNNYLTFYNNHIQFDGESAVCFHREMVEIFDSLKGPLEFKSTIFEYRHDTFIMPPKVTDVLDLYDSNVFLKSMYIIRELIPLYLKNFYNYYFSPGFPNYAQHPFYSKIVARTPKTLFKTISIDSATQKRFLGVLKQHGVTFTPFLDILINYCMNQTILHEDTKQYSTNSLIVISGRRMYPQLSEKLKFQTCVTSCVLSIPPVNKFDLQAMVLLAKLHNKEIQHTLTTKAQFKVAGALTMVDPYTILQTDVKIKDQDMLFEISNLGFQKIETGDWKIEDMVFSQTVGGSLCFGFSTCSTPYGMNITLGYHEEFREYPVEEFVDMLELVIKEIGNSVPNSAV